MQCPGVVIAAHNASHDIDATLSALLNQNGVDSLRVVVAVNNCTDDTAEVASDWSPRFRDRCWQYDVISTPDGKAAALNAADKTMPAGVRIYLDQDAVLSSDAVHRIAEMLQQGSGIHFTAPRAHVAPSRSRLVRHYYSTWEQIPYVRESPVTIGVYAVSEIGRRRWDAFPMIHSDDKFVRLQFDPSERRSIDDVSYTVRCPNSIFEMIRHRRRYMHGNRELSNLFPTLHARDLKRYRGAAKQLLSRPSQWPAAATLVGVHLAASLF